MAEIHIYEMTSMRGFLKHAAHSHKARVSGFEFEQLRVALDQRVPILFITAYKHRTVGGKGRRVDFGGLLTEMIS